MGFFDKYGQYILLGLTVLNMASGVFAVFIGIWAMFAISPVLFGILMIIMGPLWFAANFVGFQGVRTENRFKLKVYGGAAIIFVILGFIGMILNATGNSQVVLEDVPGSNSNVATFFGLVLQVFGIVLAFGLCSAIEKKRKQPPVHYGGQGV